MGRLISFVVAAVVIFIFATNPSYEKHRQVVVRKLAAAGVPDSVRESTMGSMEYINFFVCSATVRFTDRRVVSFGIALTVNLIAETFQTALERPSFISAGESGDE